MKQLAAIGMEERLAQAVGQIDGLERQQRSLAAGTTSTTSIQTGRANMMRTIVVLEFTTLDGVIQAGGGPEEDTSGGFKYGGWTAPYFDDALGNVMAEQMAGPFALLLGRKTFEIFASHWPQHADA